MEWVKNYISYRNKVADPGNTEAGVHQGFLLDLSLFLVYVKDITDNLGNLARLFADDTSLSYSGENFQNLEAQISYYLKN